MNIVAYTDGGCRPTNPGPGAHSAVIHLPGYPVVCAVSNVRPNTTNNIEELSGPLLVTTKLQEYLTPNEMMNAHLKIWSDSQYLVKGMTEWIHSWLRRGWVNSAREPVKNRDLWEQLLDLEGRFKSVTYQWVRGHNGDQYNTMADELCSDAIDRYLKREGAHALSKGS